MYLTESILVSKTNLLSKLCHYAKNLYNLANWYYRQDFFHLSNLLSYYDLDFIIKYKEAYRNLPSQTSQQILKVVIRAWKSYFNALREYKKSPSKFQHVPKFPKYKKKNGEFLVVFPNQQCRIKEGYLYFPKSVKLDPIKTRIEGKIKEVRIVPLGLKYKVEIVYEKLEQNLELNRGNILSIDLGLNNLITAVNNKGLPPFIIKGKILKSINHYYNKQLAQYRSIEYKKNNFSETKRIRKLHLTRNNKVNTIFHRISKQIVKYCKENDIGTIVIGYNEQWKQSIQLGKKTNQQFVQIPFSKLIHQLEYKGKLIGMNTLLQEESYTSKCSFLDNESIEKQVKYKGKRISRGLFKTSNGIIINADVNASYNILKKAFPKSIFIEDGIKDAGLHPLLFNFAKV